MATDRAQSDAPAATHSSHWHLRQARSTRQREARANSQLALKGALARILELEAALRVFQAAPGEYSDRSELAIRLALTAPLLAEKIAGKIKLSKLATARRNAANHVFDTPAALIRGMGRSSLNALQRGTRRSTPAATLLEPIPEFSAPACPPPCSSNGVQVDLLEPPAAPLDGLGGGLFGCGVALSEGHMRTRSPIFPAPDCPPACKFEWGSS